MKKYLLLLFLFPLFSNAQVDLSIDSVFHRSGVGSIFNQGLEYYQFPYYQYTDIEFSAILSNVGTSDATNAFLKVEVFKDGIFQDSFNSDSITLCSSCSDSLYAGSYLINADATYKIMYSLFSDSTESIVNNSDSVEVIASVQNSYYRRDNGVQLGEISNVTGNLGDPLSIGPVFEVFEEDLLMTISIGIDSNSVNAGHLIYGSIFKFNPLDSLWYWENQTNDYLIESNDVGNTVELELDDCVQLNAGDKILVAAGHYGGIDPVIIKAAQLVKSETVMLVTNSGVYKDSSVAVTNCPMVYPRMGSNYDCSLSLANLKNGSSLKIQPNPASEQAQISYNLNSNQNTFISVVNMEGKEVLRQRFANQIAGDQSVSIDIRGLNDGVYLVRLVGENYVNTQRLVIQH